MNLPTLTVELDLGNVQNGAVLDDAGSAQLDSAILEYSTPAFATDISSYVRGFTSSRGSARELQRIEAGTGSVLVDNRDRRFTPLLSSSPYFPDVVPMRRIRATATWSAVVYPIISGFVEAWPIGFPGDKDNVVEIRFVDAFTLLSRAFVSGDFVSQGSGARVSAILDAIGWPGTERVIATGVATVPAVTLANVSALEHLQQIEYAEGGRLFMDRSGKVAFAERTNDPQPDLSTRTWADNGTGMSYREISPVYDDELILNDVRLTRTGGVEQVSVDLSSQGRYGIRTQAVSDVQLSSDGAVLSLADTLIDRYREPALRLESVVDNAMRHGLWDRVLAREINDYAVVIESETETNQVSRIEGISHEIKDGTWTVSLAFSPTEVVVGGILDDGVLGLLDSTAILA